MPKKTNAAKARKARKAASGMQSHEAAIRPNAVPKAPTDSETVVSNTAFLMIGQVVTGALSLLLVLAIARYLGNVGLGSYSAAIAISALLMQLLDFGIPTYAVREIARRKESAKDYVSTIMGLRTVISFFMAAAAAVLLLYLVGSSRITIQTAEVMGLAVFATALSFLAEPLRAVLLAYEKHNYYAAVWIIERLAFVSFALAMLLAGKGLLEVMLGFALSALIALAINAAVVWKNFTKFSIIISFSKKADWKNLIISGMPFWLSNLLMAVYSRIDTLMLSVLKGFAATGLYNAAYKLVDVFTFVPLAVSAAFYPTLSRLFKNSNGAMLGILYKRAFYYLAIVAIPMGIALTTLAGRVMKFLYTSEFAPAATALQILIWAELFIFMNYLMGYMLNSIDKQKLFTISTGIYAAVNILLNLAAIPKFGYMGAATVALITQALQAATLYHFCSKSGYALNLPRLLYKPAIAAAAMGGAIMLLQPLHLLIIAPAAGAIYGAVLVALGGLSKDDFTILKGLLSRATGNKL